MWLPPAYKGQAGGLDVGYGVYDTYDLGEFDQKGTVATKYGTKDEYLACIRALQAAGVQALGDVVLNHRMGADATEEVLAREVAVDDRNRVVAGPRKIRAWTRFCFPGRHGRHSAFTWDWRCFHGVDWDDATHRGGIYLFDGKSWDDAVDHDDNGNYDYLMGCDVDLSYQSVYDELVRWGKWYLDATGLDGFRFDALKHMGREFYQRWLPAMRDYAGRELFSVGEYWTPHVEELVAYINDMPTMRLFDVPLHYHFYSASCSNEDFDLSRLFDRTLSTWNPVRAVTFVENHDTQPGQALQSLVLPWFKPSAYACILLREAGYPCVFYGDLYGMPNDGGNIPAVVELPLLMEIRRRFAYGRQRDWLDDADTIGWTREGERALDLILRTIRYHWLDARGRAWARGARRRAVALRDRGGEGRSHWAGRLGGVWLRRRAAVRVPERLGRRRAGARLGERHPHAGRGPVHGRRPGARGDRGGRARAPGARGRGQAARAHRRWRRGRRGLARAGALRRVAVAAGTAAVAGVWARRT